MIDHETTGVMFTCGDHIWVRVVDDWSTSLGDFHPGPDTAGVPYRIERQAKAACATCGATRSLPESDSTRAT